MAIDAALEASLRDLLDRDAVWQVMQRYARGLDRMDNALALSCYWPEAIEDHSQFVGSPADFVRYADGVTASFVTCAHALHNHTCELAGDEAFAETYFTFTGTLAQPPHFLSTGRYVDHFVRRGGEWRIANRVTIVEGSYGLMPTELGRDLPPAYAPDEQFPGARDRSDASYHRPPRPRRPKASGVG